jgi:crotonobetainyl-CoA:carnitine CoA-transferase CaiB-like acyl-CoA transferase
MGVHGRDAGVPRRLGLDVASVAAGIAAAQGVLAGLVARARGHDAVRRVETSVLQGALLFLRHHLAIATCGDPFPFGGVASGAGPPFHTADGHWVELEVLSGGSWTQLWRRLGVEPDDAAAAWLPFVYRYLAGRCSLPPSLHEATRRHTLAELCEVAAGCDVAACRLRTPAEQPSTWEVDARSVPPWTITPRDCGCERGGRTASSGAPLEGFRVVEVTSRLQGPLASLLLHMLGAEVVKVEPPGGDFGRHSPPLAGSRGAAYVAYNAGKQPIELDYKRAADRARLVELVAGADVFLHNWRRGRAERIGLDFDALSRARPDLVYAHASGWGGGREPAPIAGDYLVQAHTGCGVGLNPQGEAPFPSRLTLVDVVGGLLACEGVLAALYQRERTGRGGRVDTSLLAASVALQGATPGLRSSRARPSAHVAQPRWAPLDRPIETADGYHVVDASDERARVRLSDACGLGAVAAAGAAEERIVERIRRRPAALWASLLADMGVPAAVARTELAGLPADPDVAPLLERTDDCWMPGAPWRLEG